MRFMFRLIVLGLAGLGMLKAWEMLGPRVSEIRDRASGARDRMEPAIRDAADTLQTATRDAAEQLSERPSDAGQVAPDAFGAAAERVSPAPKMAT
jgi:hypothetical protein